MAVTQASWFQGECRMPFVDKTLHCLDCGKEFVFTAGDAQLWVVAGVLHNHRRIRYGSLRLSSRHGVQGGHGKIDQRRTRPERHGDVFAGAPRLSHNAQAAQASIRREHRLPSAEDGLTHPIIRRRHLTGSPRWLDRADEKVGVCEAGMHLRARRVCDLKPHPHRGCEERCQIDLKSPRGCALAERQRRIGEIRVHPEHPRSDDAGEGLSADGRMGRRRQRRAAGPRCAAGGEKQRGESGQCDDERRVAWLRR